MGFELVLGGLGFIARFVWFQPIELEGNLDIVNHLPAAFTRVIIVRAVFSRGVGAVEFYIPSSLVSDELGGEVPLS